MSTTQDNGNRDPLVSILVPCRNEKKYIATCLRSILQQEPPPDGFEVIVADGMSDDGTREILAKFANVEKNLRLVDNPARIVSTGLNLALKGARGKIIVRMDAHTRYASDYVKHCVEVLRETNADNVGGPWVVQGQGLLGRAIATAFQSPFANGAGRAHNASYEGIVDTVFLGCWRREIFDRIGLFDEELVRNQDDEFNLRLTREGGRIWQSPRIKSYYTPRESLKSLFLQYMQYGYWKVPVIRKHKVPASIRHIVPGTFLIAVAVLSILSIWIPYAAWCLVGLIAAYSFANLGMSLLTAFQEDFKAFPLLPLIYGCFHFGYGIGFLRGILDFAVAKRRPAETYLLLTRRGDKTSPHEPIVE